MPRPAITNSEADTVNEEPLQIPARPEQCVARVHQGNVKKIKLQTQQAIDHARRNAIENLDERQAEEDQQRHQETTAETRESRGAVWP